MTESRKCHLGLEINFFDKNKLYPVNTGLSETNKAARAGLTSVIYAKVALKVSIQAANDNSILSIFNLDRHDDWTMFVISSVEVQMFLKLKSV